MCDYTGAPAPDDPAGIRGTINYSRSLSRGSKRRRALLSLLTLLLTLSTLLLTGAEVRAQAFPGAIPGVPGSPVDAALGEAVSENKPGSVLFYNYYTSDSLSSLVNTRISVTNVSPTQDIAVHVFFIDSISCNVADFFLCLTRNQTTTFVTSDMDPNVTGYIVMVAVDSEGKPTSFNYLGGEEYAIAPTGHRFGLAAIAAARRDGVWSSPVNSDGVTSTIFFNGDQYDYLPQGMIIDSFPSQISAVGQALGDTRMLLYSPLTNLMSGSAVFNGSLFFLIYNDQENSHSGQLPLNCYISSDKQRITSVRTVPNVATIVPSGRTGWARFFAVGSTTVVRNTTGATVTLDGAPILGAVATRVGAYFGGHNLRYLTSFSQGYSISIPVIPPDCGPVGLLPATRASSL